MDAGQIFKIITNSTLLATRLLPSHPSGPLSFQELRYCTIIQENAPISSPIASVSAINKEGLPVQYSITGGNQDGLFTIDKRTGFITLAAHLDYEFSEKHLLEVSAESGKYKVRTSLHVLVADVNDSPPFFKNFKSKVTVIEEDDRNLPRILTKVAASDPDIMDQNTLVYSMEGEGVSRDTPGGPIFSINPSSGEVILLRAVDRDPPFGRSIYKIKVKVRDGNKEQMTETERENSERFNVGRARRKTDDFQSLKNIKTGNKKRLELKRQKFRTIIDGNKSSNDLNRFDVAPISMQIEIKSDDAENESAKRRITTPNDLHLSKEFWPGFEATLSDSNGLVESNLKPLSLLESGVKPPLLLDSRGKAPSPSNSKINKSWKSQQFWLRSKRNFMRHQEANECSEDALNGSKCHRKTLKKRTNEIFDAILKKNIETTPEVITHRNSNDDYLENFMRFKIENIHLRSDTSKISGEINCVDKNEPEIKYPLFFINDRKRSKRNSEFPIKIVETYCKKCEGKTISKKYRGNKYRFSNTLLNQYEVNKKSFSSFTNYGKRGVSAKSITKSLNRFNVKEKISNYTSIFAEKCFGRYYLKDENVCFCLEKKLYLSLRKKYFLNSGNAFFASNSTDKFSLNFPTFETFLIDQFFTPMFANELTSQHSDEVRDNIKKERIYCANLYAKPTNGSKAFKVNVRKSHQKKVTKTLPVKLIKCHQIKVTKTLPVKASKNRQKEIGKTYLRDVRNFHQNNVIEMHKKNDAIKMIHTDVSKILQKNVSKMFPKKVSKLFLTDVSKMLHLPFNGSAKRSISNWSKHFFPSNEVDRSQEIKFERSSQTFSGSPVERNETLDLDQDPLPSLIETGFIIMDPQNLLTDPKNKNILDNFRAIFHSPEEKVTFRRANGKEGPIPLNEAGLHLSDETTEITDPVIYPKMAFQPFNFTQEFPTRIQKTGDGNSKLDYDTDIRLLENANNENNLMLYIPDLEKSLNRVERDTIKMGEPDQERRGEKPDKERQGREFCTLADPKIKMTKHVESPFIQYDTPSGKEFAPFLSRIYMETNDRHEASVVVTIIVKDINDNAPVFPNSTMYGEVQENGPIDLPVTTVTAWDADDATSGTNARLIYSLEKNVVDEKTGEALFSIHPRTGELRTALCCLDRETTPEYRVQVVASDGGGLKGSGTVIVRLADVNDNSPRLARDEWNVVIDETPGGADPMNDTLLEISVTDPDISNYFFYRVVESSGNGWNYFGIRTVGSIGELFATESLDYENMDHRNGFRFDVEVTDRGPGGWNDSRHVDRAHVNIVLRDVNDNAPIFQVRSLELKAKEDVPVDTLLAKLAAKDEDEGENGHIDYALLDSWGNLRVDRDGGIRVWRNLDREGIGGDSGVIRIVATDRGTPKRSATATLTVSLQDVNDCPPRLLPPHILHVLENAPPKEIGVLQATDDDIWSDGNGPPFEFSLAKSNPEDIFDKIALTYDASLNNGRGGAKLWTRKPLDREEHRSLTVEINLSDSRGLTTSQPVYIVIDDVNDNMMTPGSKTVYLWKTKDTGLDASLGRIYVEDPDDWDLKDKSFEWIGAPHPLFTLDKETGTLFASSQIKEGRYDLLFGVTDVEWKQHQVQGNVTVIVHLLSQDALTHAVPLSLSLTSPTELTRDWNPLGGGGTLGALLDSVKENIDARRGTAMVVSVYGTGFPAEMNNLQEQMGGHYEPSMSSKTNIEETHVWISYQEDELSFMNPIKLRGILEMNIYKIRRETNLLVNLEAKSRKIMSTSTSSLDSTSSTSSTSINYPNHPMFPLHYLHQWSNTSAATTGNQVIHSPSRYASATSLASTALPLQVVDNNSTSFVSPRLLQSAACASQNWNFFKKSDECLPDSCLNGGKCVSSELGKRCVCPGGTLEPFCKITSRGFGKGGWAWINPVPLCAPTTISFKFLTAKAEGVLLYSGPLASSRAEEIDKMSPETTLTKRQKYPNKFTDFDESSSFNWDHFDSSNPSSDSVNYSPVSEVSPLLTLYLSGGRLHLSLEGSGESAHLKLNTSDSLDDGQWHTVHLMLDDKNVNMRVDYCILRALNSSGVENEQSCSVRHYWTSQEPSGDIWGSHGPLQIGGLAQRTPKMEDHRWKSQPVGSSIEGCISDLRIGGELIDLGAPAYSYHSHPGCDMQKNACIPRCGAMSICIGGLGVDANCVCPSGITGLNCDRHSMPVSLESQSFAKVALSFTPDAFSLSFQLRLRTRSKDAAILFLSSQESKNALALKLRNGIVHFALVDLKSPPIYLNRVHQNPPAFAGFQHTMGSNPSHSALRTVSLEEISVNDGRWHTIKGGKYGNNLLLEVDNGDLGKRNETILHEDASKEGGGLRSSLEFKLDTREGITIGGIPHFANRALTHVEDDLSESCLDDVRIQGKQVPLPLVLNETKWGQVTTFTRFKTKCIALDSCKGKACKAPLVCRDEWRLGSCRCPPGEQLTNGGCQEMDMCLFGPCLNGGSCIQDKTGMSCLCKPHFSGQNCEWEIGAKDFASLLNPIVLTVSISVLIFLALFVIMCCVKFHLNLRKRRRKDEEGDGKENSPQKRESADLEIFYIYDRSGSQDKALERKHERVLERETAIMIKEGEIKDVAGSAPIQVVGQKIVEERSLAICQDDLRAYAYEGESSSTGSLTSALSGQQRPSSGARNRVNDSSSGSSFERCYRFTEEPPRLMSGTSEALKAASAFV